MIRQNVIGLIGGMSWESSAVYYRLLNEGIRSRLGGLHSVDCILRSLDFSLIEKMQAQGDWTGAASLLAKEAKSIEDFGAQGLVLCTNTMHKVAAAIQSACQIPFLHIADAVGKALVRANVGQVLLTGTRFTMEEGFYRDYLQTGFDLRVSVPSTSERQEINRIIYQELCLGQTREESKHFFCDVISKAANHGDQGVILGCTELQMLTGHATTAIPIFDSTSLHVEHILDWMLD
ncbi:MAG: amino acid racemase [Bdellovibrionaceae bacterium]|nr:amino acid racemase [Bdellovibrionales bacterium]MCB9085108.1 amino acid racemase [Pseudobdellovibrionaceae bacterium]